MKPDFFKYNANPAEGMEPSDFTSPEDFTTDDKTELNWFFYTSDDESVLAGVWESAPCREEIESYSVNEMMTVISGSVTVSDPDSGRSETYTAGDSFFIAKGTKCIWEITETLRKFYFIAE